MLNQHLSLELPLGLVILELLSALGSAAAVCLLICADKTSSWIRANHGPASLCIEEEREA